MDLKKAFGRRIKTLRDYRGWTQNELAERLGRSVDAVSMIERGKNWPSVQTVEHLATALEISTSDLFDDLARGDVKAPTDNVIIAKEMVSQLSVDDLPLAIAMLETLLRKRTGHPSQ